MKIPDLLTSIESLFDHFHVTPAVTIDSPQVQVTQFVRFSLSCHDQAMETLTIHNILHDIKDRDYEYLKLIEVVDGPFTDGNREQMVDDCKIQTIVKLEPYIEGITNNLSYESESKPKTSQSTTEIKVPDQIKFNGQGCQSDGANVFLPLVILFLFLFGQNFKNKTRKI